MRAALPSAFLLLVLTACSSVATHDVQASADARAGLPDSIWQGTVTWKGLRSDNSSVRSTGEPFSGDLQVMVTVCDGRAKFWKQHADGRMHAPLAVFKNESYAGSHLIYYQDKDDEVHVEPGWVETQMMMLVEIKPGLLRGHWSRVVSNPALAVDDPDRSFFVAGVGDLKRVQIGCPDTYLKSARSETYR